MNKEADRVRIQELDPWEILRDIRLRAGPAVADRVLSVQMRGYNEVIVYLKGHGAKQALANMDWIQKWEPSVTLATKNECELLLSGVPKIGTTEETAKAIWEENGPGYMGLNIIRASWWGKTWQDERKKERQSIRIVVDNAKITNRLIDNTLGLRAIRIKVRRF